MDVVLNLADELILDCWWSKIFPNEETTRIRKTNHINLNKNITTTTTNNLTCERFIYENNFIQGGDGFFNQPELLSVSEKNNIQSSSVCISRFLRDHPFRQSISIFFITLIGVMSTYFILATFSYYLIFDKKLKKHPKFLKNQIKLEILCALKAFAPIDLLSLPFFLAEVRGYSKLYNRISDIEGISSYALIEPILEKFNLTHYFQLDYHHHQQQHQQEFNFNFKKENLKLKLINFLNFKFGGGWFYLFFSYFLFLFFTDFTIYLIHKCEHHPKIYKRIHKVHHRWVIPTPYASYAFHPVDGFLQSVPYHIFIFLIPMHRVLYLTSFIIIIIWTILIHDSELIIGRNFFQNFFFSPSHHTLHHQFPSSNFGLFFTCFDQFFLTYRSPSSSSSSNRLLPSSSSSSL